MHTHASITATVRRVAENQDSHMHLGFNHNRFQLTGTSMLPSQADAVMFDWSHTYLQDGITDAEFGQFMSACEGAASYHELHEFVAVFAPPRAFTGVDALFTPNKIRGALKNEKFMCDCGEFCTLAPMIARYLREVARFERAR